MFQLIASIAALACVCRAQEPSKASDWANGAPIQWSVLVDRTVFFFAILCLRFTHLANS